MQDLERRLLLRTHLIGISNDELQQVVRAYAPRTQYNQRMGDNLRNDINLEFPFEQQTVQTFLDMYLLIKPFDSKKKDKSDRIRELIKNNMKEGQQMPKDILTQYSIEYFIVEHNWSNDYERKWHNEEPKGSRNEYNIYMDAPLGFGLMYYNVPVAVVGLHFKGRRSVLINQLQGVRPSIIDKNGCFIAKGDTWPIAHFYWPRVLAEYVALWAGEHGFEKIGIKSAKHNKWNSSVPQIRLRKIYDNTAQDLGYQRRKEMDSSQRNWYKALVAKE